MGKIRFFKETLLLADISIDVVLGMSFLAFNNADVKLDTKSFIWKTYSVAKTLSIARRIKLINKHKFSKADLYKNSKLFIMHFAALKILERAIDPSWALLIAVLW